MRFTESAVSVKACLVIPHYNHIDSFEKFLVKLDDLKLPCIVIDDGSEESQKLRLRELLQSRPNFHLYEHAINRGKGAAMLSGAHAARALNFSHMLQIDADGQHNVDDVGRFFELAKHHPTSIISGAPQFDDSAPKARVYGRKVTDFWVALETWSFSIKDSLCGFRIYPLREFEWVSDKYHIGKHMDFDTDIMVKSVWENVDIQFIDTGVVYLNNGVSHFHYLSDNLRLIYLHTRLMLMMLIRMPLLKLRLLFNS